MFYHFIRSFKKIIKLLKILKKKDLARGLFYNVAAAVEHFPIFNRIKDENINVVVDIGANKGQFALISLALIPKAQIICFEPLKEPKAILDKLFKNKNVEVHNVAIGNENMNMKINVSKKLDSSSLLKISDEQEKIFPGTEKINEENIKVAPLDDFIDQKRLSGVNILKIDVQGYELEVLRGSFSLLHCFKYVYVECSFVELYKDQPLAWEVIKYLSENKFQLVGIYNLHHKKNLVPIQADFFFEKIDSF